MTAPKFTVFTPTYNRAHTITRVYDSLNSQTFQDFEWLVVDDGSTDDTSELFEKWTTEAAFPIIYQYQKNSGKHRAFNRGVQMAMGELFLVIDSDDAFLPNSLETMLKWWDDIPAAERERFTGIVTLCQYEDGTICGQTFPTSPLDTNALDLRFIHKMRGETWGFHRTTVLKAYPFPEDEGVYFIPENLVWDEIAKYYKIRCINEPLRIFFQDAGNQVTKVLPQKKALVKKYFLKMINRDFSYFRHDPITFSKWAVLYIRYSMHRSDWGCLKLDRFDRAGAFFLCCLAIPFALCIYFWDVITAGRDK